MATPVGAGERGPAEGAASGAPGGAAPLRHWGARAVATARGGPRHGPQGAPPTHPAPPGAPFPLRARGKEKRGKGDARRPKIAVPGRRSVVASGEQERRMIDTS